MDEEKLKALGITLEAWQAMSEEEKAEQLRQLLSLEDLQNSASPTLQELYNGTSTLKGTELDLTLVNKDSKPDDGGITKNSLSIALQRMRGLVNRPSYSDFEELLGSYVNEDGNLSWKDRRNFRKALREKGINMSRSLMRRIGKSFNRGETNGAFNNYVNSLERKYYIKDGKLYTQGQDGYEPDDYNTAESLGKAGTDVTALVNKHNLDVINARKNAKIVYDPITNTYKASGKVGDIEFTDLDITNADWAKDQLKLARNAWFEANKNSDKFAFNSEDGSYSFDGKKMEDSSWLDENFTKKLRALDYKNDVTTYSLAAKFENTYGKKGDWSKLNRILNLDNNIQKSPEYEEKYRLALDDYLKDYTLKNGSVAGTALYNYLQKQGLLHVGKGTDVNMNPDHPWLKALLILSPINNEMYNLKIGGNLNTKKVRTTFKNGGQINKFQEGGVANVAIDAGKRLIPIYGTYLDWKDFADNPNLLNFGAATLSTLGDATLFFGGTALKGASTALKAGKLVNNVRKTKNAVKTAETIRTAAKGKNAAKATKDLKTANKAYKTAKDALWQGVKSGAKNMTDGKYLMKTAAKDTWKLTKNGISRVPFRALAAGNTFFNPNTNSLENTEQTYSPVIPTENNFQELQPIRSSNYKATGNDWFYKQGGNINMNKINYFLEGGAMAPLAAPAVTPALGGQDIQAQVMQLVQAAMNGDKQATLTILLIMQAAQLGDLQAVLIAQIILDVAKLMQGQATAAKYGAKLSYIKSLRSGCPEGYEVSYHKKGGVLCKECIAKSHATTNLATDKTTGSTVTSTYNYAVNRVNNTISRLLKQPQNETDSSDITSLHKKGGCLKKKLSCGKKMQEGSKVDEAKCGTKIKAACGTKTTINKCGSKLKKKLSCGKKMQEGDKINEAKCGSKMKAACGTKATMDKCGGKAKKKCLNGSEIIAEKCGGKTKKKCLNGAEIMEDKCGGKATKKKCLDGAKVIEEKCGGKTKKKKCSNGSKVIEDKCGGKAKKKKCLNGGILTIEALQTAYKSLNA